jgi:hypothetical protein
MLTRTFHGERVGQTTAKVYLRALAHVIGLVNDRRKIDPASRSIAELLLHFAKSLAFTFTSQVSLVLIHNPTDSFDATRHTKIDI